MKCPNPNCNREVSPDWKLCPFCGFEPKKCSNPACPPRWLPQEAKFCPVCGDDLNNPHNYAPTFNVSPFFTICGLTLGQTSVSEVLQHREQYSDVVKVNTNYNNSGAVLVELRNGASVWAFDKNTIFHVIMLFRNKTPMFDQWRKLGFDWSLSYDQWYSLFSRWGFEINVVREPYLVEDGDKQLFFAEFDAVLPSQKLSLNLEFGNDGKTGHTDSPNTLDSILVEHLEFKK